MASFAFGSLGILWFLIVLAFYGFILYFLFSVLRFMKEKTENDRARNEKLDLLISQLQKSKRENEE